MTIPEVCGLWIEQRFKEELETKGESGASLRSIGRKVAAEVEKNFETTVNPETIAMRASRQSKSVTNVTPGEKPAKSATNTCDNCDKLPSSVVAIRHIAMKSMSLRCLRLVTEF